MSYRRDDRKAGNRSQTQSFPTPESSILQISGRKMSGSRENSQRDQEDRPTQVPFHEDEALGDETETRKLRLERSQGLRRGK